MDQQLAQGIQSPAFTAVALYCVVGSRAAGEMKLSEIEPILARISAAMVAGNPSNVRPTIATATTSH